MVEVSALIDLPERELVRHLLDEWGTLHDFFNFMVVDALGPPPRNGWDYLFLAEVPTRDLGFPQGCQPGDVDVLIVPTYEGLPRVEFAAAIEVKRLALRGPNWDKNVDRYGVTQAHGLLAGGFPYVGILHLIVNLEGPPENKREGIAYRMVDPERDLLEYIGPSTLDITGYLAAKRQHDRLLSRTIFPTIGINCLSVAEGFGPTERRKSTPPYGRNARPNRPNPILMRNLEGYIDWMRPYFHERPADVRSRLTRP